MIYKGSAMSNLICPFCQQEYIITKGDSCFGQQRCVCRNPNCEFDGWHFPIKLVSELIRTRKALDVALDWLGQVATLEKCDDDLCREFTKRKLAEIKTVLEQKEHFADAGKTIEQKDNGGNK